MDVPFATDAVRGPSPRRRRRFSAVLVLDVVGSSRLLVEDQEATLASLRAAYRGIAQPAVSGRGGRVVKLMGDGLLAEFPQAAAAVRAALEVQRRLAARDLPELVRRPLAVRAGLHAGEVIRQDADILGATVTIAARLEGAAPPGGILLSREALVAAGPLPDVAVRDLGLMRLRNVDRPVDVLSIEVG